jgi:hypothetical protein
LLFWGAGIKPGHYDLAASPEDLAKTIGAIVGVEAGGADAHVLPCVQSAEQELIDFAIHILDPQGKIPRSEMRIDPVEINGDKATVRIWVGRAKPAPPGKLSLDCGSGHVYNFEKKNGKWVLVK